MCVRGKVCLWADRALQTPHRRILVTNEDEWGHTAASFPKSSGQAVENGRVGV